MASGPQARGAAGSQQARTEDGEHHADTGRAGDPAGGSAGVHVYPLGGSRRSAKWSYAVADGCVTMAADGKGFGVEVELG